MFFSSRIFHKCLYVCFLDCSMVYKNKLVSSDELHGKCKKLKKQRSKTECTILRNDLAIADF